MHFYDNSHFPNYFYCIPKKKKNYMVLYCIIYIVSVSWYLLQYFYIKCVWIECLFTLTVINTVKTNNKKKKIILWWNTTLIRFHETYMYPTFVHRCVFRVCLWTVLFLPKHSKAVVSFSLSNLCEGCLFLCQYCFHNRFFFVNSTENKEAKEAMYSQNTKWLVCVIQIFWQMSFFVLLQFKFH